MQSLPVPDCYMFEDQVSAMVKTSRNISLQGEKTTHMIPWIFLMRAFFSRHLTVFAKMSVKYSNILNTKIAKVFFMCISGRNNLVKVFYIHKISYIPSLLVPFPFFQFPFRTILQQMNFLRYNEV